MARCVVGLFENRTQVDSVVGALRDAGFEPDEITVAPADGQGGAVEATTPPVEAATPQGLRAWLTTHLVRRGVPHTNAQQYGDRVAEGRLLVTVAVSNDAQDADARNLLVTAGAGEISSAADGHMIAIRPPGDRT
jgi:hypothetical protein